MFTAALKKEVQSLSDFFTETDIKIHGEVTEQTKQIAAVQDCYVISTPTRYRKGIDGWEGSTDIDFNGYTWHINTSKGRRGISTWITTVVRNGNTINFGSLCGKPEDQDFKYPFHKDVKMVTEKVIREAHEEAIEHFKAMAVAGELAKAPKGIEVGQILFTHGNGGANERAVYEITDSSFGKKYKCVLLDGSGLSIDDHVRPYTEKFGIGVYYNEGETVTQEEIDRLLPLCIAANEAAYQERQAKQAQDADKAAKRKEYLSQFQQADNRKRAELIKVYILREYPTVSKVEVKSDSFSGGDSIDITYHSPEKIEALSAWIRSFAYGKFDGMTDMYEYSEEKNDIIVDGYILPKAKYASAYHVEAEPPTEPTTERPTTTPPTTSPTNVQVTLVSDKGGIEIKFPSKPDTAIIDKLKSLGFRWSRFNSCWWANQSTSRAEYARSLMGDSAAASTKDDNMSGYIDAQEQAFFDNQYRG